MIFGKGPALSRACPCPFSLSVTTSVTNSAHPLRSPGQKKKYQNLRCQRRETVQHDIADGTGPRRDESLMPFVQARHQGGHEECNRSPAHRPSRSPRQMQCSPPGAKQKKAQGKVAHKVAAFPYVVMHHLETCRIQTHQEMKQWIEKPSRVFGGERVRGLDRDQSHPQQRSNPGFD